MLSTAEKLFPKGLSRDEYNDRMRIYLKSWRKEKCGWNKEYALAYYHRNKDEINKRNRERRRQAKIIRVWQKNN
jgi:hypothetical protein